MQSGSILTDEFSRAGEGRADGGESGKVSQETHSTTAVGTVAVIINKASNDA